MGFPKPLAGDSMEDLDGIIESLLEIEKRLKKGRYGNWRILRDLRWDLIVQRAEVEDPGDAPVFDNTRDLLAYLKIKAE